MAQQADKANTAHGIIGQASVSNVSNSAFDPKYDLLRAGVVSQSELTKSGSDAGSGALDAARLACFDACCMRLVQSPTKYQRLGP